MKIKDLMNINPEAEIIIVFADGTPYKGKLTYGWGSEGGAEIPEGVDSRSIADEVCIFLGDVKENFGEA